MSQIIINTIHMQDTRFTLDDFRSVVLAQRRGFEPCWLPNLTNLSFDKKKSI